MRFSALHLEVIESIGYITFRRSHAANSINLEMAKDLLNAILYCDENPDIKVVVLTGSGNVFCPGGDIKSFAQNLDTLPSYLKELLIYLNASISYLARMEKLVIASVNGIVAGSGMSLVCASDLVIASKSATFTAAYTRSGLSPDASLTYFLPRMIGTRRAVELSITNRSLTADAACDWGIVNLVVPDVDLIEETKKYAKRIAHGATEAYGATKKLYSLGWNSTLETQMEMEARTISELSRKSESLEGIMAFIEKRSPHYH